MSWNCCNEAIAAETHCSGCIATAAMSSNSWNEDELQKLTAMLALQLQQWAATVALKQQLQKITVTVALQLQQWTGTNAMKLQLRKLTATVALQLQKWAATCNKAVAAEIHCNGCIASAAMNWINCNDAAAAGTNCNSCIAHRAGRYGLQCCKLKCKLKCTIQFTLMYYA